jgi:hypothetical protein
MTNCYECDKYVPKLVWNSRCQECVDRRIAFNRKCIADGEHVESATEELTELGKTL